MLLYQFCDLLKFEPDIDLTIGKQPGVNLKLHNSIANMRLDKDDSQGLTKFALHSRKKVLNRYRDKLRQILVDIRRNSDIIDSELDF